MPTEIKQGRPTQKTGIDMEQMKKLVLAGWTDQQVCDFFKINIVTLHNWKQDENFFKALKGWKDVADHRVEESLYKRATGYTHEEVQVFCYAGKTVEHKILKHYAPDTVACIFWLKNRKKIEWRDKQETEYSGSVNLSVKDLITNVERKNIERKNIETNRIQHQTSGAVKNHS